MDNCCDFSKCAVDGKIADRVICHGVCGKSYHPICTGISKRSIPHLKDYLHNYVFYCDECKNISLSHVLLAVKCLSESINSISNDNNAFHKHVTAQLNNLDEFSKNIEILINTVESYGKRCLEMQTSVVKEIASLTSDRPLEQNSCAFDDLKHHIKSTLASIPVSNPFICLNQNIASIRTDLDSLLQSSSRFKSSEACQVSPLFIDVVSKINDISDDLAATRISVGEISEEIKAASCKIDELPDQIRPTTSIYNTSILAELTESYDRSSHPPSSPTLPQLIPSVSPNADEQNIHRLDSGRSTHPPSPPTTPIPTVTPNADHQIIHRLGTTWTLTEWNNRLKKISAKSEFTPFFIKGTPKKAGVTWIQKTFLQKFGITLGICKKLSFSSFKIEIPSKYEWLFSSSQNDAFMLGKAKITKWITYSNNKNNLQSSSKSNLPKDKLDSNWSFKTNIFPNFSPLNYSNTVPQVSRQNRVSFNLEPSSDTSLPTNSSSNKFHNFIHSHTLNPAASPFSPSIKTTDPSSPSVHPPIFDPMVPPSVKLTSRLADLPSTSNDLDGRYMMSRLRDSKLFDNVRLYLAYLYDKPDSVCIEGKTKTNLIVSIQKEGLPTEPTHLRKIYTRFHEGFNISPDTVTKDLATYASHVGSKRVSHLQSTRKTLKNYYRP